MTLHRRGRELRCHHCGARRRSAANRVRELQPAAPSGRPRHRARGRDLARLFPDAPLARLDRDTAGRSGAMQAVLDRVHRGEARILVGTQMLTKGHHFPDVSLVVILDADQGLFASDFRATERLAQTITQVAGGPAAPRARARSLIQTSFPEHPLLTRLIADGLRGVCSDRARGAPGSGWPPYSRLALLRAEAKDMADGLDAYFGPPPRARRHASATRRPTCWARRPRLMARRADHFRAHLLIESPLRAARCSAFLRRGCRRSECPAGPHGPALVDRRGPPGGRLSGLRAPRAFAVNCRPFHQSHDGSALKTLIETLLRQALAALPETLVPAAARDIDIEMERTRDASHGDFASNIAMRLAKAARQNPRKIAEAVKSALPAHAAVAKIEIAGAGFINFFLDDNSYHAELGRILAERRRLRQVAIGRGQIGAGGIRLGESDRALARRPRAPCRLTGRASRICSRPWAIAWRASTTSTMPAARWKFWPRAPGSGISRNAASVSRFPPTAIAATTCSPSPTRLLRGRGRRARAQSRGDVRGSAARRTAGRRQGRVHRRGHRARAPAARRCGVSPRARSWRVRGILGDIREDLAEFGVTFDSWFSERSLIDDGSIDRAVAKPRERGHAYRKDGALWFKSTDYGDEKDRVMVRENGIKTYFSSDIAFVFNKRERGFEHLLYVWGADHHGYIARLRAGLVALGGPPECFEVRLVQFVTLFRGGEKAQMSTRSGEFVTLRALRGEVGNDAARLFYVMRSNDQHLDFDLELAKARSNDNPVYYIQYAHARVASVKRQMQERGLVHDAARGAAALGEADGAARDQADQAALGLLRDRRILRARSARRMRWCTTCGISPTISTPTTAPTSSSSRMRRCAMRG